MSLLKKTVITSYSSLRLVMEEVFIKTQGGFSYGS
jgi:hypothetical protein